MMDKKDKIKIVKNVNKVKLSNICKSNKIDPSNFSKGKVSKDKVDVVYDNLIHDVLKAIINE